MMHITLDTAMLVIGACLGMALVYHWHRSPTTDFDLRWVLVSPDTNKVSLGKVGQFMALLASTWVLIHDARAGTLSEWQYTGYMLAWAGTGVANKYLDAKNADPTPDPKSNS